MKKNSTIFLLMGILYVFIEVTFNALTSLQPRLVGESSLWMFLLGGTVGLIVGKMNECAFMMRKSHLFNVLLGASILTTGEFIAGCILNIWFKFNIWNYSESAINLLGQIDWIHCLCWIALTPFVFWVDDAMRHYMFGSERPPTLASYYLRNIREPK